MTNPTKIDAPGATKEFGHLSVEDAAVMRERYTLAAATARNGVRLFVDDRPEVKLSAGEQRVYPFVDEGEDILTTVRMVSEQEGGKAKFDRVVDCFSGGGNSMLPVLKAGYAERGFGIDLNPRAVQLAGKNAQLNELDGRATFAEGDVNNVSQAVLESDGRTLFIANPPFALTTQEKGRADVDLPGNAAETHLMRAGGRDGLTLTRAYITQALAKAFADRALQASKPGDVIVGVAYSRIGTDGSVELEKEIQAALGGRGTYQIQLIEDRTLWRGPNGRKEQPNPMPLTSMRIKGTNDAQREEYDVAAANHLREGFDRLGYYRYIIRVGETEQGRDATRGDLIRTLDA